MSISTQITVMATAEQIIVTAPGSLRGPRGEPGPMGDVTPEVTQLVEDAQEAASAANTAKDVAQQNADLSEAFKVGAEVAAQTASDQAAIATSTAESSVIASEQAQFSAGIVKNTTDGIATGKQYFSIISPDSDKVLMIYENIAGVAVDTGKRTPSALSVDNLNTRLDKVARDFQVNDAPFVGVFADTLGNVTLGIEPDGTVSTTKSKTNTLTVKDSALLAGAHLQEKSVIGYVSVETDIHGNIAIGIKEDGTVHIPKVQLDNFDAVSTPWSVLSIGKDDSIVHVGDSYTGSYYAIRDKSFLSQLSAFSPFRHQNYGISGDDALDMQYRIVNGSTSAGLKFQDMGARYAFITTLTNDSQFRSADLSFYAENIRRLVETIGACGPEPVITTEFPASSAEHALLRRVADEMGVPFIDCTSYDVEVGGLKVGPFHQGHPGTRTNGVFWLPMLDFIDKLPKPERAIKIFRPRPGYAFAVISDLLYKDRVDRSKKWKELSIFHVALSPASRIDELNKLGTFGTDFSYEYPADEYQKISTGQAVTFSDYALMELSLPGNANTLDVVVLDLKVTGTPTVYVRDYLDVAASMPGKIQGSSPTNPTYLSKWNTPRGAWRSLGAYGAPITLQGDDLRRSMQGDKLIVLVAGAFDLSGLEVRYRGRPLNKRSSGRATVQIGNELILHPLCGTPEQLGYWTVTGTPSTLIPIDQSNAPRKPGINSPVDGVCVISDLNTISHSIPLPAETGQLRRYELKVFARYFPKAFLDPSLYPGIDLSQVIDRIANPGTPTITSNTLDVRTLKCEVWSGASYPTGGGVEFFDFAPLQWRPISFIYEALPYRTAESLTFKLSCPDGEIQVAKVVCKEIY